MIWNQEIIFHFLIHWLFPRLFQKMPSVGNGNKLGESGGRYAEKTILKIIGKKNHIESKSLGNIYNGEMNHF